jgi:hypothetical protein
MKGKKDPYKKDKVIYLPKWIKPIKRPLRL